MPANPLPIRLFIHTPRGLVPLSSSTAGILLPRGPDPKGPILTYGSYLRAIEGFLRRSSNRILRNAVVDQGGRKNVVLPRILGIEVAGIKHGALYHVARIRVDMETGPVSLALNTAVLPEQQAAIEAEFRLLKKLRTGMGLQHFPRVHGTGSLVCTDAQGTVLTLKAFLAEWFDGFHEFHWSIPGESVLPAETLAIDHPPLLSFLGLRVWDGTETGVFLTPGQIFELYRQAAAILTDCLDVRTFREIAPWHHAAGDFVVGFDDPGLQVRLITARGYRRTVPRGTRLRGSGTWIGLLHFLTTLTIRMRLDRLDGVGPLVWAPPSCVSPVIDGFLDGWRRKVRKDPGLPSPQEIVQVLRRLDHGEWVSVLETVLEQSLMGEERSSLLPRTEEHAAALIQGLNH